MFRLITINCNGLREPLKLEYLKTVLNQNNVDVCLVQETHIDNLALGNLVERKLNFRCFWSFTENSKRKGVGILVKKDNNFTISSFKFDPFGRYVSVDVNCNDADIRIISVYAPNNACERKQFFNDIYPLFLGKNPIILGGDFNCVENLQLDKMGGNKEQGNSGWLQLKTLVNDFNLVDCYRKKYPSLKEFTWASQNVSCRLDRFYISSCLFPCVQNVEHKMYTFSDHHMVSLNFSQFNHQKLGSSYWKFNSSLLKDLDYIDFMNIFLTNNIVNYPTDQNMLIWWDELKSHIRSATISFCKNKKRRERFTINTLQKEYKEFIKEGKHHEATNTKEQIKKIDLENMKGAQIRSKALQLEGEKPSKYFLYKELSNNKKKLVKRILNDKGEVITESEGILNYFKTYFANLFEYKDVDDDIIDEFLTDLPCIDQEDKEMLDKCITVDEIVTSLNNFQNNKTPGSDGLTKEFYICFIDKLLPILLELYNVMFENGFMSNSQKLSYISVICKNDNNPENVCSYRPISLLNVDYKILTKLLSKRLEYVLDKVIHPDQTCSIPSRSIIDNCHIIRDIIEYSEIKNINGILLSLDQEKAFDQVSHHYLLNVLKAFGIGDNFIKWIKIIYNDISSSVIINHFISDPFPVFRSVRQGCCLSPLLYVLCLEPVLIKIRKDNDVKGFQIPGNTTEQKISAFADDCNFSIKDDKSADKVIKHFERFGKASGSKLNKVKSKGLYLGKWKTRADHPFGISWVKKIKIFGILFGDVSKSDIWNPIIRKIVNALNLYKSRIMSLYGKACVINTMCLSKLWYVASVMYVPEDIIAIIDKEIFKFLWGENRMELLSRNTCYFPKRKGGISLNNVLIKIASIQLAQISKIVYNQDVSWTAFGDFWLGIQLKRFNDYSFSNTIPHCIEDLPVYYDSLRKTLLFVRNLDEEISPSKGAHCKFFYTKLIDAFMKIHNTNIQQKYPTINFDNVFSNVSNNCIDPLCLNVTFKMAHKVLPVAERLNNFGININKFCSLCKHTNESIEHLFFYCIHVQWSKRFLVSWLHDICECGISTNTIIFSIFDKDMNKIALKTALIILSEYRLSIWQIRNKIRFEKNNLGAQDIVSFFLNRMKYRIIVDFHRLSLLEFQNMWMHKSICNVTEGKIEFKFDM